MKKIVLLLGVLVLSSSIITESLAECTHTICYDTWNPGIADNCGDGCTYDYEDGKLTVTATKAGATIPEGRFYASYNNNVLPTINNVEIVGDFSTIGMHAFVDLRANITGKDGVLYTNNIGHHAFGSNTFIGTIIINNTQNGLGSDAPWYNATLNGTVILPSTITSIDGMAFWGLNLGNNAQIYCGSENCDELFNVESCNKISEQYQATCRAHLATLMSSGKLHSYPDGCATMNASGCTKCKNENFRLNDGECDRLRYTPAEAAKVLHDNNTNSVTITFKK